MPVHLAAVDGGGFVPASLRIPTGPDAEQPAQRRARAYWIWAVGGFLLLAVGLVFSQTVHYEFVELDDPGFVYENPNVTAGLTLSGLRWALTDGPFGEWCPLSTLSQMLDCQFYGLAPGKHHLTNILLHAASSVLLFLVLLRMTGDLWPSAWVASIFAIHPLHVESVAWVAERRDVLSGLFFMLTLGAYVLYAERPSPARYLVVAGCFVLGLMAKPMLVTVPFVLLLLDYWPLRRLRPATSASQNAAGGVWFRRLSVGWRLVVEKVPLMALAAVSCGIVLSTHTSTRSTNPVEQLSLATRIANALVSYAAYVIESIFPVDLAVFYPHLNTRLPTAWVVEAVILLIAISAVVACFWRNLPCLPVGWLWYLGTLVPVIGLVQIGAHARADRYTYLSQIGLSIALAWGVWSLYQSRPSGQAKYWCQWLLVVVSGGAVLVLGIVAWRQTSTWRNTETLWLHAVACTEQNALAHYNLGSIYAKGGKPEEAITQFRAALDAGGIDRQLIAGCHDYLAESLTTQGKLDEALSHYEQAVSAYPEGRFFHAQLAMALASRSQYDRAIAEWRETIRLNPALPQAHIGLASALLANGNASEAAAECRAVLEQEPDSTSALVTLGWALSGQGKFGDAIPFLERALKIEPRDGSAHFCLGLALDEQGSPGAALTHLKEAIRLQPDNVLALWQTAWILATSPDPAVRNGPQAAVLANQAIQISGGREPHAFDALAAALADAEQFPAAIKAAERASALARARGDDALVKAIEQRARLYRQGLPYRKPAPQQEAEPMPAKSGRVE